MSVTFPLIAGLIASILHVITGPDHLAAVVPFAIETKKNAWKIGLSWGIGHLFGMMMIGILFLVFKEIIPVESISVRSEQLVGLVLIVIGIWVFIKIFIKRKSHKHLHIHSDNSPKIHKHKHEHEHLASHSHTHEDTTKQSNFGALSIGFLHGLAGVAHFILFLPVLSFDTQSDSIFYIAGFGLGIIIAMTSFAFVIGKLASVVKNGHNDLFYNGIRFSGGLFAILIGIYWLISS